MNNGIEATNGSKAVDILMSENMALRQRVADLEQECKTTRQILHTAPVFLYVYDVVEQHTVFGNLGLAEALGYTDIALLQQMGDNVLPQLMHPDDLSRFPVHSAQFGSLPDTVIIEFEYRMRHTDGSWRWFMSRDRVFSRDAHGNPRQIIGVVQDITLQKQSQDALRFAQVALDHAGDAIFWADANAQCIYANHAACASLGYTHDELLAMHISDVDRTLSADRWQEIWQMVQQQGTATFESQHWRKDGSNFPVEMTINCMTFDDTTYIYGFARDITERKHAEYEQSLAKFTLDRAVDSIHWLTSDGRIMYANDMACTMLGYTRTEMLSMRIFDLDPFFREQDMPPIWRGLQDRGVQIFEAIHRHKDGHDIPVEVVSNYLEFQGQEYACTFARDISMRKREEAERASLQQHIIEVQRAAIRELSTPIIPISDTTMIMPLIGTIDSARAQQVLETLLEGVAQYRAAITILDITGVLVVDTQVASALIQAAQAVRLLGARVVITGIRPDVAQTLVHLGADLSGIVTRGTLQAGIEYALGQSRK